MVHCLRTGCDGDHRNDPAVVFLAKERKAIDKCKREDSRKWFFVPNASRLVLCLQGGV